MKLPGQVIASKAKSLNRTSWRDQYINNLSEWLVLKFGSVRGEDKFVGLGGQLVNIQSLCYDGGVDFVWSKRICFSSDEFHMYLTNCMCL